jgi:hypothetical protein
MSFQKRQIEVVDSTILGTLDECPRKCQIRFQYGATPRTGNEALDFGRVYHDGVHTYYRSGRDLEKAVTALAVLPTLAEIAGMREDDEKKEVRGREKAEELLRARTRLFHTEEWEWLGGEQQFIIELPGVPLRYAGFIDGFGRDTTGAKGFSIQEEKTSKSPWHFQIHPNAQVLGYIYAARTLFEQDVRRGYVTMAGIYVSSIDGRVPAKKKADPPREAVNRSFVDAQPWDLEEWLIDTRVKVNDLLSYQKADYWPKRTKSCGNYGGCPYRHICVAPPNVREFFLESQFDQIFWSPIDERR